MKILLADDSVTAQQMGKKILSEAGHEVIAVSNGAAALKKVTEIRPDLVILDIYMPGYSGLEVCQRMKEMRDLAHVPVLLTVGKLEPFRKEDAKKVRAEALIIKPFEASELTAAIEKISKDAPPSEPVHAPKPKKTEKAKPAKVERNWDAEAAEQEAAEQAGILKSEMWKQAEPRPPVSEFEVVATPNFEDETATPEPVSSAVAQEAETNDAVTESAKSASSIADSAPPKAAAAAAGAGFEADYGGYGDPETESPSHPSMSASVEGHTQEASPLPSFSVGDSSEFEDEAAPKSSLSEREPEPAPLEPWRAETPEVAIIDDRADADSSSAPPAVDPAFDPDRTRWASEYATRFIDLPSPNHSETKSQDEDSAASNSRERENEQPQLESGSLGSVAERFVEEFAAKESAAKNAAGANKSREIAPAEDADSWTAEDVEVAADEAKISLVQEMQQKPASHQEAGRATAEDETSSIPQSLHTPFSVSGSVSSSASEDTAEPSGITDPWANPASETGPVGSPQKLDASRELGSGDAADQGPSSSNSSAFSAWPWGTSHADPHAASHEDKASKSAHEDDAIGKRDFSVEAELPSPISMMESAAEKVRKATDDAVQASENELRGASIKDSDLPPAVGTGAIEDMVNRVFEQLKPKLVAEITRGLSADHKNKK